MMGMGPKTNILLHIQVIVFYDKEYLEQIQRCKPDQFLTVELNKKMKKQPSIAIMARILHDGHATKSNMPSQM
jgi:hypothetical protein